MVMVSKHVFVVENLKLWTQLIMMETTQFLVSNYLPLTLPENKPFANRQIHQYQFHWKWFEIDHELIFK